MTSQSSGRLLISHITLRGPELAQVYGLIAASSEVSLDDLRERLMPAAAGSSPYELSDAPLREALSFLMLAGLIEGRGRQRRYSVAPEIPRGAPFPLALLRCLQRHADQRQRAISLVQGTLIADDLLSITPQALRDRLERGPLRNLFAWTGEKVHFWAHLTAYLGLIRRPDRSPELLVVPQPTLIHAALGWASQRLDNKGLSNPHKATNGAAHDVDVPVSVTLAAILRIIDAELLACFTARGRVHRGLAQTLLALERLGQIRLSHSSDAAQSLLLGERRVSEVTLLHQEAVPLDCGVQEGRRG
jgi:hypothetical protein